MLCVCVCVCEPPVALRRDTMSQSMQKAAGAEAGQKVVGLGVACRSA